MGPLVGHYVNFSETCHSVDLRRFDLSSHGGRAPRIALWVGATCLSWLALYVVGWPASVYRDFDFFGFWAGGRAVLEGLDPYDPRVAASLPRAFGSAGNALLVGSGYGYPLPTALLTLPFSALPLPIAAPGWLVLQVAAAAAALIALGRRLFPATHRRDTFVLLALLGASQAAWVLAWSGNIGGFLIAIVAVALVLLLDGHAVAAGALLGLLVVKPHLFLWAVPLLLVYSPARLRIAAGGAAVSGALLLASLVVLPGWPAGWLASALRLQGTNVSRANAWGPMPADARWLGWIAIAAALAAFLWWWAERRPDLATFFGVALALSLLGAPYVWSNDHVILGVTAAVALAHAARLGERERAAVLVALAVTLVFLPWLLYLRTWHTGDEPATGLIPLLMALIAGWSARAREPLLASP